MATVVPIILAWVSILRAVVTAAQMLIFSSLSLNMVITTNTIHPEGGLITGLQLSASVS